MEDKLDHKFNAHKNVPEAVSNRANKKIFLTSPNSFTGPNSALFTATTLYHFISKGHYFALSDTT